MSELEIGAMWREPGWMAEVERLVQERRRWEEDDRRLQEIRMAASEGWSARVRELLAAGWPLNEPRHGGCEALRWAIYGGQHDLVRELLALGADLEVDSNRPETALAAAVINCHLPGEGTADPVPLELLLAAGARLRLHEAVLMNDLALARTRLEEGADPNFGEGEQLGPVLMIAAREGFTKIIDLLLRFGARIDATDDLSRTALMDAREDGRADMVAFLLARGACPG